jgi:beta-glucanase (GH16 family)
MKVTKTETQIYSSDLQSLDVASDCLDIIFFNQTGGTVYVNGFPIVTNGTLTISCNEGEINATKYRLSFNGQTGNIAVIRRML